MSERRSVALRDMRGELTQCLESCLRAGANRRGWILKKSSKEADAQNHGGYRLTDREGRIVAGQKFELTYADLIKHLS